MTQVVVAGGLIYDVQVAPSHAPQRLFLEKRHLSLQLGTDTLRQGRRMVRVEGPECHKDRIGSSRALKVVFQPRQRVQAQEEVQAPVVDEQPPHLSVMQDGFEQPATVQDVTGQMGMGTGLVSAPLADMAAAAAAASLVVTPRISRACFISSGGRRLALALHRVHPRGRLFLTLPDFRYPAENSYHMVHAVLPHAADVPEKLVHPPAEDCWGITTHAPQILLLGEERHHAPQYPRTLNEIPALVVQAEGNEGALDATQHVGNGEGAPKNGIHICARHARLVQIRETERIVVQEVREHSCTQSEYLPPKDVGMQEDLAQKRRQRRSGSSERPDHFVVHDRRERVRQGDGAQEAPQQDPLGPRQDTPLRVFRLAQVI